MDLLSNFIFLYIAFQLNPKTHSEDSSKLTFSSLGKKNKIKKGQRGEHFSHLEGHQINYYSRRSAYLSACMEERCLAES